ncbi:serine hydrolase [Candidatus Uabimicrobium amorphum]|uniref:Penicillin-binding protein 4 n=1 Tax=Uabimicrobium amorphum TaxID=2596890 RepID=A0A5S9INC5_UABAM|nr:serine hydrolase [Candidatus Uabimicrobium amorphum]BBM85073.1 penicillin-binding protein 4* [Candidatus Uabimicrobium amorphum]
MRYLIIVVLLSHLLLAQTKSNRFDEILHRSHNNREFNGNVLIVKNGKVIYKNAIGYAEFKNRTPLTINSQFRLASVSKQFTAMAIVLLYKQQKLKYDDDIVKYLPQLPYKGITIRHLLHHTSGLADYMYLFESHWDKDKIATNNDIISLFAKHKPPVNFTPGERWEYSNTGYALLASIVESAAQVPFHEFVKKYIFTPLDMKNSLVYSPLRKDIMTNRVYGVYWNADDSFREHDFHFLNGIAGDGGIYSTLEDLLKWDRALYTEKLLSKKLLAEVFTSGKLQDGSQTGYGFGWGISKSPTGKKRVSHSGGWVGFRTNITRDVEENNTIIFLSNVSETFRSVRRALEDALYEKRHNLPRISIARKLIAMKDKNLDIYAKYQQLKDSEQQNYRWGEQELETIINYLLDNDKTSPAIQMTQSMIDEFPDSFIAYYMLANAYEKKGDTKKAIENYRKSLEIHPGFKDARRNLEKSGIKLEPIKVDAKVLQDYVGKYQLAPTFFIIIRCKDNHLTVQVTNQEEYDLFPMSQNKFYLTVVNAQLSFHRNKQQQIRHLILHQNKRETFAIKIK